MKKINITKSLLPKLSAYINEIESIWDSHQLTSKGTKHEQLEKELKDYLQVQNTSLFVNGHLALEAILEAYDLKGEIITTAFTFPSTTHAIVRQGCTPVFADIKADDYTLDPVDVERKITDKTVAILPVHVLGNVCDVEAFEQLAIKYNVKIIYDAAHVFGVKYRGIGIGHFGDSSMFSMNATKVFNTIEGGLLTFNDQDLSKKLELIKYYGIESSEDITYIGSNLKMNEFQAAMGLCNLPLLKSEIDKRKKIANYYISELKNIKGLTLPNYKGDIDYNYIYFPILINHPTVSRDSVFDALKGKEINTKKYFYPLVTEYQCYKGKYNDNLPVSNDIAQRVLCLPIYGELLFEDQEFIILEIKNILEG
jgi:dTDP-4-amino-4,6-dideoxygalactose transaminase